MYKAAFSAKGRQTYSVMAGSGATLRTKPGEISIGEDGKNVLCLISSCQKSLEGFIPVLG